MTVPGLFAAALEPALGCLYLTGGLISFRSIVETEFYEYPLGNVVPNFLAHTDLPELTASLAPRKVTMAGAIDANGKSLPITAVQAEFAAASNIRVQPQPNWTPTAILSAGD